ncbi:MAG: ribonuclease M5 [Erysipelotrichaceae bacterium]
MKQRIKELIVVEGKHDVDKLNQIVDCDVICTNGLAISQQQLDIIKQAAQRQGVIVMTDPDNAGNRIREIINRNVSNSKQVFIDKKQAIGKRNVGIEYVDNDVLLQALNQAVEFTDNQQSISWSEFIQLGLIGNSKKRDYVCEKIRIGLCNNKKMFKYLNMLGYNYQRVKEICDEYDSDH